LEQLSSISIPDVIDQAQIERIQKQGLMHIRKHELGDIVSLKPEDSILMSYYRNNSLHTLIIPSLVACCLINSRKVSIHKLLSIVRYAYPFLKSELHLPWNNDELESFVLNTVKYFVAEGYLKQRDDTLIRPDRSDKKHLPLMRLAQVVQPILERYYMTFIMLWQSADNPMTKQELETKGHLLAQKISMIYGINSPDFFDRKLFTHFITTLFKMDYVSKNDDGKLRLSEHFNQINIDIRALLSVEVRSSILQIL
jgi:glycerol-3-phosphate O-acyltransferase